MKAVCSVGTPYTHTDSNGQGLQQFLPGAKQIISLPYKLFLRIPVTKRQNESLEHRQMNLKNDMKMKNKMCIFLLKE